jgi:hypothetical protein
MKIDKACGPDILLIEHLRSHVVLLVHIKLPCNVILIHDFNPGDFDNGVIAAIMKDEIGNISSGDN